MIWLAATEYMCYKWSCEVNIFWSCPHSWLLTGLATKVTRRMPLMKYELFNLPEHLSSPGFCVEFALLDLYFSVQSLNSRSLFVFSSFVLTIVLYVLLSIQYCSQNPSDKWDKTKTYKSLYFCIQKTLKLLNTYYGHFSKFHCFGKI